MLAGSLLVVVLALLTDVLFTALQHLATPPGVRSAAR